MSQLLVFLFLSLSVLSLSATPGAAPPAALDSLVQAERQFSATSVEKGMRHAFLAFLATDAVIFRPLPVNGRKVWEGRDSVPGTLIWEPSYAEVAAAGDLGYTTGPWEYRPADRAGPIVYGHFISVWKKQGDGAWRVMADIGVQHEKPERGVGSGDLTSGPPSTRRKDKSVDLATLDRGLSEATRGKGLAGALSVHAAPDLRLNRDGFMPSLGLGAARAAYDSVKGSLSFGTRGTGLSQSQDLGYTYGLSLWFRPGVAEAAADSGVYLHVWRRGADRKWKLALAVENPL